MTTPSTPPVLEAREIVKTFPGVRALDGAGVTLRAGRLNALMGENGAGKSTLMSILAGVRAPDSGEVLVDGVPQRFRSPSDAQRAGVAIIHQELCLAPNLSVAANLFLGREPRNRFGLLDHGRMEREARGLLSRVGAMIDPRRPVSTLTVADQQVVEIAKAVVQDARVLILDEPTSALTAREAEALFALIRQLKADGVALAYITHRFEELDGLADEVTIFRDGKLVAERHYSDLTRQELVRLMIGRDLAERPASPTVSTRPVLLSVRDYSVAAPRAGARPLVDRCSLEVREGEVVGLFGLLGAGRTELMEALFGSPAGRVSGQVLLGGEVFSARRPAEAYRAGVALMPEDRKAAGLVLGMSVTDNATLASLPACSRLGLVSRSRQRATAHAMTDRLRLRSAGPDQAVRLLSGGNQQKVVLAKQLLTRPRLIMLDEPTRGIDVGAKQEVYSLVRRLASEGKGVIFASSETAEVLLLADRILVLCEGKLTAEFARGEADAQRLVAAALPGDAPRRSACTVWD